MAGMFEIATKTAIDEIIEKHAQESKFGFIITRESKRDLADEIYDLLITSRNLKAAGDRFLGATGNTPTAKPKPGIR